MSVSIYLSELHVRVLDLADPDLDLRSCCFELFFVDPLVVSSIYLVEGLKVLKPLSKGNQEYSELTLLDIVIAIASSVF